jgi:hypothetical protein
MTLGRVGRAAVSLVQSARDAWLIVGITLLLFLALEGGYRLQSWVRTTGRPSGVPDSTLHPYAKEPWWPAFQGNDGVQGRKNRFDPYRGYASLPYQRPGITVNQDGIRPTVPPPMDSTTALRVMMLGGSAMWGVTARDSFTIPSLTAKRLRELGFPNVLVENRALPGYNSTQEGTTLLFELAKGARPDVVVTYDGYNDVQTAIKFGAPGRSYNTDGIQSTLDRARSGFWQQLVDLGRFSALVQRLRHVAADDTTSESVAPTDIGELCHNTATYYGTMARSMEALGQSYGFTVLFFLQPHDALSHKPFTSWERSLGASPRRVEPFRRCAAAIDSVMQAGRGVTYFPLYDMFDAETTTVFVDQNSHITETANREVAERIAEQVALRLKAKRPAAHSPPQ